MSVKIAYHGTSYKIDYFNMNHAGKGQGQSIMPGIYWATNKQEALRYAEMSSEKTGQPPRVYIAELEIENPLIPGKGGRYFVTRPDYINFLKKYFPSWFDASGNIESIHAGYANEKYSTFQGQYGIVRFAAEENGLSVLDVVRDIGFDSAIDGTDLVITDPSQILSFEEIIGPDAEPSEDFAGEALMDRYLVDSRKGKNYKTMPGNRYKRRLRINFNGGNNVWYDIDVNKLFRQDKFLFHIPVIGETDNYVTELEVAGWLIILKSDIQREGFSVMTFKKSLAKAIRLLDVKQSCTCRDFKFRFSYQFTRKGDNSGAPENRPANITNPNDDLGRGCKHLNFVTSLRTWLDRISRILFNYCFNLWKQNKPLFNVTIGRKLGITDEMIENRPIRQSRPPKPAEPQTEEPRQEEPEEESEETEEPAEEAYYGSYYRGNTEYDEDQTYMIEVAQDQNIDVSDYVTPENSPEQIWEVAQSIQDNLPKNEIITLANPDLNTRTIQVLREAYKNNIDLSKYSDLDPDVLKQLIFAGKKNQNLDLLALPGFNHRQVEMLRSALELDYNLYNKLAKSNMNYEQMRNAIRNWKLRRYA